MNWLKPSNSKNYDHHKALKELKVVTWKSGAKNIKKGDILYIYATNPEKRITHKCLVEQVWLKKEEIIDDNKYVLSGDFNNEYEEGKNYIKLRMLETYNKEELKYDRLKEHGLRNKQSMSTISDELVEYIEKIGRRNQTMKRLFIGNINKGTEELNEKNTITAVGKKNWFGDLKLGDWTLISEKNSTIDKLLEVELIEKYGNTEIYHFKVIKKYKTPKKAKELLSCKFFDLDLVILNKALRRSWYEQFFELKIKEKYKNIDFSKIEFSEKEMRYIYVAEDKERIENKREGDLFIITSSKKDGYRIKEVLEYDGEGQYEAIDLKKISNHINIQKYGFIGAYESAKKKEETQRRASKSPILNRIISDIEKEGYYKHNGSLSNFYDIMIVNGEKNEEETEEIELENGAKNVIIYGVPGSGKSHYIESKLKNKPIERVIFYPEYSYFDFIGQKIPTNKENGTCLSFEPGSFARILAQALGDPYNHYYLVIEEINRGKAEAIFGDIFQLLDRDEKGESKYQITNLDLKNFINEELRKKEIEKQIDKIYIPSNLSIYASLNNADQNVFNFDTAFGRRWEYELMPCNKKDDTIYSTGYIKGTKDKWSDIREEINEKILQYKDEIYNAEEKRLGLYYIDEDCLKKKKDEVSDEDEHYAEKFANKIFRYLYLNVFKNNEDKIFKNQKVLEDYISEFKKDKNIDKILELGDRTSES